MPSSVRTESAVDVRYVYGAQSVSAVARVGAAAKFRRIVALCEIAADWVTITSVTRFGYFVYWTLAIGKHVRYSDRLVWTAALAFATVMVLMLDRAGAYRSSNSLLRVRETEHILRVFAQALLAVFAASFFASVLFARWLLGVCLALIPLALFLQKHLLYVLTRKLHQLGYGNERVLIYGAGGTGRRVYSALRRSPKLGLVPVAVVDDDPRKAGGSLFELAYERRCGTKILPGPVTADLVESLGIDLVIIAIPSMKSETFLQIVDEASAAKAKVSFVPSQYLSPESWVDYRDLDGILLASTGQPVERFWYEMAKRVLDVVVSCAVIILGTPAFLTLALLIKLDSRGPLFFRQDRVGQNGSRFCIYKFRTMRVDACPYDYSPKDSRDHRITKIGRVLRKTSLDELPQLLNVVRGNMSLVGPRPEMPFIVEQYSPLQAQRLRIKPGITGLWQLSGDRAFLIHENIEYDFYYLRHRNFFMDLAILLHTCVFAMRGI